MVWNICQKVTIPLSVEDTLMLFEKNFKKGISELKPFDCVKPYYFRRVRGKDTKFVLQPGSWNRLTWIIGKVDRKENGSQIILKMYPPLWFYILFIVGPSFIIASALKASQQEKETVLLILFFWIFGVGVITAVNVMAAKTIFRKVEEIIKNNY
ncbi:MAG: hypothetical protein ACYS1A_08695 [Planctomycetota bacterium]|jgi:hypothetical protein